MDKKIKKLISWFKSLFRKPIVDKDGYIDIEELRKRMYQG